MHTKPHTAEAKEKMRQAKLKNPVKFWSGKTLSKESKLKMSLVKIGKRVSEETKKKMSDSHKGEKSSRWISDRSLLKRNDRRNDSAYQVWRKEVYTRDNWKCKILNHECNGRIEAHHILGWASFPELRYEVNNGITLCKFHHPRKKSEESRLSPYFQELINTKS